MSGFVLDTNIPSETVKLRPEPRVTAWIKQQPNDALYLSVVTIGELRRGFVQLPRGQRRPRLELSESCQRRKRLLIAQRVVV